MKNKYFRQKGQTLVILLTYMIVAVTITAASVIMVINSTTGTTKVHKGITALDIAESGAENAMIKLIRDRNYTGESMSVDGGTVTITVSGTNPKTIISEGTLNDFTRTIRVIVNISNNTVSATSWKEI